VRSVGDLNKAADCDCIAKSRQAVKSDQNKDYGLMDYGLGKQAAGDYFRHTPYL
jgi:hypothetical protein